MRPARERKVWLAAIALAVVLTLPLLPALSPHGHVRLAGHTLAARLGGNPVSEPPFGFEAGQREEGVFILEAWVGPARYWGAWLAPGESSKWLL